MDPTTIPKCVTPLVIPPVLYDENGVPSILVTHVRRAHVGPNSDGYPETWWLPDAANIDRTYGPGYPATPRTNDDFARNGTFFETSDGADTANAIGQGYASDVYPHDQPSTTICCHDHSPGMTRVNVYAAGAGLWLIREPGDGETGLVAGTLRGPAPKLGNGANRPIPRCAFLADRTKTPNK